MIELIRHIEALLLEHDCVIVPRLGGFIAHYSPAKWVEEESLYLPPSRIVGFNSQLEVNDGLLVQSYMQAYGTDFADAHRRVEKDVEKLKQALLVSGEVELGGIGKLLLAMDQTYDFQPSAGLPAPDLYGLSSFEIKELKAVRKIADREVVKETTDRNVFEIRISRAILRNTVAAAVAIVAFFVFSTPVENTYVGADSYAELFPLGIAEKQVGQVGRIQSPVVPMKGSTERQKADRLKPKSVRTEKVPLQPVAQPQQQGQEEKKTSGKVAGTNRYNIIVASVANQGEAERVCERCRKDGYGDASVIEGDGRIRVSLCSFATRKEAAKVLEEVRQQPAFKDAWLLSK